MATATLVAPTTAPQWKRDNTIEAYLDKAGVLWDYLENVQIAEIDIQASLSNQARLSGRLMTDVVDQYTLAMIDEATFPALVAYRRADGAYVLCGGNHRLAAAKQAERTHVDLYLIKATDRSIIHLITTTLNGLEGVRDTVEEMMEHAIYWVENFGRTAKAAAAEYQVSVKVLENRLRAKAVTRRLGGRTPSKISLSILTRLATLDNDIVLRRAVELIEAAGISGSTFENFLQEIREQRTEAGQLSVIQQWREREDVRRQEAETKRGIALTKASRGYNARAEIVRSLSLVETRLRKHPTLQSIPGLSDAQTEELQRQSLRVAVMLENWGRG